MMTEFMEPERTVHRVVPSGLLVVGFLRMHLVVGLLELLVMELALLLPMDLALLLLAGFLQRHLLAMELALLMTELEMLLGVGFLHMHLLALELALLALVMELAPLLVMELTLLRVVAVKLALSLVMIPGPMVIEFMELELEMRATVAFPVALLVAKLPRGVASCISTSWRWSSCCSLW